MSNVRARENVDGRYKWRPEELFEDDESWEAAVERVRNQLRELCTDEVTQNSAVLAESLDAFFDVQTEFERVEVYAVLRSSINTTDERAQELSARVDALRGALRAVRSAIEASIQQTDAGAIEAMLVESESLARYDHYLKDLVRRAEHAGEPAVEAALSTLEPALGGNKTYETILNADASFPSIEKPDGEHVELTLNNREKHLRSPDRVFRRTVHEQFYDTLTNYRHTIASTFDQHVTAAVRKAEIRGYDSSLEAVLDAEHVPVEVYQTLVSTISDTLDPFHEHLRYKQRRLDVDELRPWDLDVRLVDEEPTIPYERAKELLVQAVEPLGEAYQTRLSDGLESGWVDVYETPNKMSGAGTIPAYSTEPYILLNYQRDVNWLFGLAHEAGHAMHAALRSDAQPAVYGEFNRFTSEVPSTLHEALLAFHVLEMSDDSTLRSAVLDTWLERFRDLLYRRTRYAVCERRMHEHVEDGGQLTARHLDQFIVDGWEAFNAPVDVDDRVAGEWMHAKYLNMWMPFYVYQYATGFAAALSLAAEIHGKPTGDATDRYLRFLRHGASDYPLNALADAGVDLRSEKPFRRAVDAYRDALATYDAQTDY